MIQTAALSHGDEHKTATQTHLPPLSLMVPFDVQQHFHDRLNAPVFAGYPQTSFLPKPQPQTPQPLPQYYQQRWCSPPSPPTTSNVVVHHIWHPSQAQQPLLNHHHYHQQNHHQLPASPPPHHFSKTPSPLPHIVVPSVMCSPCPTPNVTPRVQPPHHHHHHHQQQQQHQQQQYLNQNDFMHKTIPSAQFKPTVAKSSPATASAAILAKPSRSVLTDQEKKRNHIASERRRRAQVKDFLLELSQLVPGLKPPLEGDAGFAGETGSSRVEILAKTQEFVVMLESKIEALRHQVRRDGRGVGEGVQVI